MKKVLIIEDDQIVGNVYRNKLLVEGYQVEVANTGEAGHDLIRSFRPDAVILDLVLPKLSGVEVLKLVRAEAEFAKLPIIVFSNTYLTQMVQEAWKAGATKCLSKANCTPRQVIEIIRKSISTNGVAVPPPSPPEPCAKLAGPELTSAPTAKTAPIVDVEFETDARGTLAATLPEILNSLRTGLKALTRADNEPARVQPLQALICHARTLTSNANLAGFAPLAQLAEALEALLQDLSDKPTSFTASTQRTAATAVDCLGFLFDNAKAAKQLDVSTAKILVVDDDVISRRAITQALGRAKLKSTIIEDPNLSYELLAKDAFDLIFLDVDMPGMNGYELCTKLRSLSLHKTTPVVFVTGLNGFKARASSMMSGGNDFIAKPFHFTELAVKAIIYILRGQIGNPKQPGKSDSPSQPALEPF